MVLGNRELMQLAKNQQFLESFPYFQNVAEASHRGCGGCGQTKQAAATSTADELNKLKMLIAEMPDEKIQELKKAVQADTIQVVFENNSGQIEQSVR